MTIKTKLKFNTRAIHAGQNPAPGNNAVNTPVYFSSTFVQKSPGIYDTYDYGRTANPTRSALEENLASLHNAQYGICFSSGCAAADAIMHLLETGDHVICSDDLYGGTFRLFDKIFKPLGLNFSFTDLTKIEKLQGLIKKNTKMIWLETPTNPLLKIIDIKAVSAIAKKNKLKLVVDNTFCSPAIQLPINLGADLVVESSTKYIGGHSDIIGGMIVTSDKILAEKMHYIQNAVGAVPSPMDCYLILRSTKTLALRMERHSNNALKIAQYLSNHKKVEKVIYPFLSTHPQYKIAKQQMCGGSGMISMVIKGGLKKAKSFLENVRIFSLAESLGGVESLIEHPAIMTHASIPKETRETLGISDGLIRLSVGIEDSGDLIADLEQAFKS